MTLFVDDNYVKQAIISFDQRFEKKNLKLRQSGLKVNDSKTELCLFHRKDQPPVSININNSKTILASKDHIIVLGIIFDGKMQWYNQVQN